MLKRLPIIKSNVKDDNGGTYKESVSTLNRQQKNQYEKSFEMTRSYVK